MANQQIISIIKSLITAFLLPFGGSRLEKVRSLVLRAIGAVKEMHDLGGYEYALAWLQHFLQGSGEPLEIPEHLILEALESFRGKDSMLRHATSWEKSQHKGVKGILEVYGSTRYEGSGFTGRPQLFYLVGGFKALWYEDGTLSIQDVYDWDKTQDGYYYCSALPFEVPNWVHQTLNRVLGDRWYPLEGFPLGEPGVSNALWADLQKGGLAQPFTSYFKGYVDLEAFGFWLEELEEEEEVDEEEEEEWLNRVIRFNHPPFTDEDLYGW